MWILWYPKIGAPKVATNQAKSGSTNGFPPDIKRILSLEMVKKILLSVISRERLPEGPNLLNEGAIFDP